MKVSSLKSDRFSTINLYSFKGLRQTIKENMPHPPEFKTKLKFDPSKLSTNILKQYLVDLLNATDPEQLLSGEPPAPYTKDADNLTNYRVLKELGLMSVKQWKASLSQLNEVEQLYLDEDTVSQDSRCYYESWKIIHDEVGNHEKQMSFFRLVSEIVRNLANRNFVEIDTDGKCHTMNTNEMKMSITRQRQPEIMQQEKMITTIKDANLSPNPSIPGGSATINLLNNINMKDLDITEDVITEDVITEDDIQMEPCVLEEDDKWMADIAGLC